MKLVVLSTGFFSIPILQVLKRNNAIEAVAVTDDVVEGVAQVQMACNQLEIPSEQLTRNGFQQDLEQFLQKYEATLVVVCGFPWKIPGSLLSKPDVDFLNIHLAKLPEYKGPNPIFWEIKNREPFGAACLHVLTDELDSGPILSMKQVPINPMETAGMHTIQAAVKASEMLNGLLLELKSGNWKYRVREQPKEGGKYYPRPTEMDLLIDWQTMDSMDVVALTKAANPWNKGAFTAFNGSQIKITDARLVDMALETETKPGTIVKAHMDDGLFVACKDQKVIRIEVISLEEGFFAGSMLTQLGAAPGSMFDSSVLLAMRQAATK